MGPDQATRGDELVSSRHSFTTALQRKTIDQMLRLGTSENKKGILLAAQLAEKDHAGASQD